MALPLRAVCLLCLLAVVFAWPGLARAASSDVEPTLERIALTVDHRVLNPIQRPHEIAHLLLTGFYSDGTCRHLDLSQSEVKAETVEASGEVRVVSLRGDEVIPEEGGIARIDATVASGSTNLKASVEIEVRPFFRDYHQTLVLKLMLGMEGDPVERLANDSLLGKPNHDVLCTFQEALEVIRKTDNLTRGIPKIVYLVGWQKGGHDHLYPDWSIVNPKLKRAQDSTALQSLGWLIRAARKFHTTVSLHINMIDAYRDSPLWEEYRSKDLLAREANGDLLITGSEIKGMDMYNVVYPREWTAGLAQRRIDALIRMVPELKSGHTIHVDAFIAQRAEYDRFKYGDPISPWHAKPENGGLNPDRYVETQRKIFHYWRDRGFDVTGEGIFWSHPPGEGFTGLQPMSWWYPDDPNYEMRIPESLMARGRTNRDGDGDFRFGSSMHGEEIFDQDKEKLPGFLGMFCRTTLPWYYLSRLERVKFESGVLKYSDGVVAQVENGHKTIRKGDFILREDDDLFVPALWHEKEIIAYSRTGYVSKTWRLPSDWAQVKACDLYEIGSEGCVLVKANVPVKGSALTLSLKPGQAVSVVPTGAHI
jgi:hypothetical protein